MTTACRLQGWDRGIIGYHQGIGKNIVTRLNSINHVCVHTKLKHDCEQCDRGLQKAVIIDADNDESR